METNKKRQRAVVVSEMMMETDFSKTVADNPVRVATALGFCETGEEITRLIALIFKYLENDKRSLHTILQVLNGTLDRIEERKLLK